MSAPLAAKHRIREASEFDRIAISCSSRRDHRPELLCSTPGNVPAEFGCPKTFTAEVVAPSERAQCEAMQDMLFSEPNGTEHLMSDAGAFGSGFSAANFCRSSFEKRCFIKTIAPDYCVCGRPRHRKRGCRFPSEPREVVLDSLEFPNWSVKGNPLIGIRNTQRQNRLKRAGSLDAAADRPHQHQSCMVKTERRLRIAQRLHMLKAHDV